MPVPPSPALAYSDSSDPAYEQHVANTWELRPFAKGVLLASGTCPRCAVELEIPAVLTTVRLTFRRTAARNGPAEIPMTCNCDEEHGDRPPDVGGCGAFWLLRVPEDLA
ncbi:hypothetical protein [Streptomyces pseudovenezuelae]|uniref:Uncharacterized protein n=1 Tax=Streptomyces pseudovenezuelae TaxID=67350 RepID=A0ABT6LHC8_9ACTN|nr:hypothetical protein [Streptomyces pseudovenezuelae]MDH6215350.1 hypothetical protein [Streptomyces pseudovenezuelae]